MSLTDIHVPLFAVSTIADQVAPWRSVYKIQMLTEADVTFVLSNGATTPASSTRLATQTAITRSRLTRRSSVTSI